MPTLLLTHPDCLLHDMGEGHPERPDRLRAIEDALSAPAFAALKREQAPLADLAVIERAASPALRGGDPRRKPAARPRLARSRHRHVPEKLRRGTSGHRRRGPRGRSGDVGRRQQCLLRRAAPRASRRAVARHGLLPVQLRGHRRAACPRRPWRRARGGGRFRRASRQRHAGCVLVRQGSVLRLNPPDAALPRHRRTERDRRRQYLQRAAQSARRQRPLPRGVLEPHPAGAAQFRSGRAADLGRVRRPSRRPACPDRAQPRRISPGSPRSSWRWPRSMPAAGSSPRSRAATIFMRSRARPPPMSRC